MLRSGTAFIGWRCTPRVRKCCTCKSTGTSCAAMTPVSRGTRSVATCQPTSASPSTFTRTNRTPSTWCRSRATRSTSRPRESCASTAARPAETTGSRSLTAYRRATATSTCCVMRWPSTPSTHAASTSGRPAGRCTYRPTRGTTGYRSSGTFQLCCPSRSRRCHDPGHASRASEGARAHRRRGRTPGQRPGHPALHPRRARSQLSGAARDNPRPEQRTATGIRAVLRLRAGPVPRTARHSATRGGRHRRGAVPDRGGNGRRLDPGGLSCGYMLRLLPHPHQVLARRVSPLPGWWPIAGAGLAPGGPLRPWRLLFLMTTDTGTWATRPTMAGESSRRMVDIAVAEAAAMSVAVTVVIVDESGVLKEMYRMDGAPLVSVQTATSKAYAAAAIGMPPDDFYAAIESDGAAVASFATRPGLALIGGGIPVVSDGRVAGAIGVAGAMTAAEDRRIAEAAVDRAERPAGSAG